MRNAQLRTITGDEAVTVLNDPGMLSALAPRSVIAAGFFDGVHRGHQRILGAAIERARAEDAQAWVLTFDRHPLSVVAPGRRPPLLTRLELRLEQLAETGIDGCLMMAFTPELAARSAEAFVSSVFGGWRQTGRHCTVVSGENWRFGSDRRGNLERIEALTDGAIATHQVPLMEIDGRRVSSSAIRAAIRGGDLETAQGMLGRPHAIRERCVKGRGLGSKLGFATANMHPEAEVLPPVGVYAVDASVCDGGAPRWMRGAANLGFSPTVSNDPSADPVLEVHIFDYAGDLHGATLDVRFLRRLRDEIAFPSVVALVGQMRRDVDAARATSVSPPPA